MTPPPPFFLVLSLFFFFLPPSFSLLSTISISPANNQTIICALTRPDQISTFLNCTSFPSGTQIILNPSPRIPFSGIVGGNGFLAALMTSSSTSTSTVVRWTFSADNTYGIPVKQIYRGPALDDLDAGSSRFCGLVTGTNNIECWQPWLRYDSGASQNFTDIATGDNFVCGLSDSGRISCFGDDSGVVGREPSGRTNYSAIAAGPWHACAISFNGSLDCWGNFTGQKPHGQFTSVALGENRGCATRLNGTVSCWGENSFSLPGRLQESFFATIEAKGKVFCGVLRYDLSVSCWGNEIFDSSNSTFFKSVLPGPCKSACPYCGPLSGYGNFCGGSFYVCQPCVRENYGGSTLTPSPPLPPPPPLPSRGNRGLNGRLVAWLVVGCVGSLSIVAVLCFLAFQHCIMGACRVHDSGRMDEAQEPAEDGSEQAAEPGQPVLEKRLSHLISMGSGGNLEEFPLEALLESTDNFSEEHRVGTGSFGSVYRAMLSDGREVAIKRAESSIISPHSGNYKRNDEDNKDDAFLNELESLSRLNHKNLVRLLGFCEKHNERILVYEYLPNGTLHDHLHKLNISPLASWTARLKVALEAARGIEYLHEYAVPTVIHRDIKSANILLDASWTAKVSDFGLSLMGPDQENDESHLSMHAAGTMGYIDPEYFRLQQLTTKSDVYSFGVVLLELLSGRKAIHRNENGVPRNVADLVVPYIVQDEIHRVLDRRVPPPTPYEIEAVAYVGYLAADCVTLGGRDRPSMTEVVSGLEKALAACIVPPSLSGSRSSSA